MSSLSKNNSNGRPILTVFGATGLQGGSVIKQVLKQFPGKFHIRAVTRNVKADKAQKLKGDDVELVEADLNNRASVKAALKQSFVVFVTTDFWQPDVLADPEKELVQGRNVVDTAVEEGVQYLIWSALVNVKAESNGKYDVPFFTQKAEIEDYARSLAGTTNLKSIFFYPPFYYQNFLTLAKPQQQADGSYVFALPLNRDTKMPMFDANDSGLVVAKILEDPAAWVGRKVTSAAEVVTAEEIAAIFSKAKGKPAIFKPITEDEDPLKAVLPPFVFRVWSNMFAWFREYGNYGKHLDPFVAKQALGDGQLTSLREWFQNNDFSASQGK